MANQQSVHLCNFFFLFFFSILITNPASVSGQPTQLVSSICKNTTNYTFCVDSLYSDPRTPTADRYVLAYISFDLAYVNATHTKAYIHDTLLSNATGDNEYLHRVKRCDRCYEQAVSVLEEAINDLDSDTYSELAPLAGVAARKARVCEDAFQGHSPPSTLSRMNHDFRGLSKICIVISNLFTTSS